jgi:hypothetical protein
MTLDDVKKYLDDNKDSDDVKDFLGSFSKPEADIIKAFKATPEFRDELQREGDRRVTSALEKFQKEKLPKHVEEEIKKRFPDESPEQKAIRELKQQVENLSAEKVREELKNKTAQLFNEKKLPLELTEIIQANDTDELTSKTDKVAAIIEKIRIEARNEVMKGAPIPPGSKPNPSGQITRDDLAKMDPADINKARSEGKLDHLLGRTK